MEQIELSRPDIRAVIHSGRAEQSPLAASFIKKVMYQFDIEIVACYAESYESMVIPKTTQKHGLFRKPTSARLPEHPKFERSMFVTVYVKETFSKCNNLIMDGMKLQIMSLFLQTLEEFHVSVPYPRLLTPEEQQAYGFVGQQPDQRDSSRIIHPNEVPMQKNVLSVESFVGLALWHIYSDSCRSIQRYLREQKNYPSIRVFCHWDKEQEQETLWLCFSFRWELEEFLTRPDALEIRHACMQRIQKHDKWGLVNDETYHPLLKVWSELDSETRSNLARDDQNDV